MSSSMSAAFVSAKLRKIRTVCSIPSILLRSRLALGGSRRSRGVEMKSSGRALIVVLFLAGAISLQMSQRAGVRTTTRTVVIVRRMS